MIRRALNLFTTIAAFVMVMAICGLDDMEQFETCFKLFIGCAVWVVGYGLVLCRIED